MQVCNAASSSSCSAAVAASALSSASASALQLLVVQGLAVLIPLPSHLPAPPDVGYGIDEPPVHEGQGVAVEAWVVGVLVGAVPAGTGVVASERLAQAGACCCRGMIWALGQD